MTAAPVGDGALAVFRIFLRLGLTSFGGPVAHIAYFREEFVVRRRWLSEPAYADLVALCQFLPGPASSQVGMALGLLRAGQGGALAAWAGFTLPSALLLIGCAMGLASGMAMAPAALQGLKLVALAVVAQAVWGMARQLCTDGPRIVLMLAAAAAVLAWPSVWAQVGVIAVAGAAGLLLCRAAPAGPREALPVRMGRRAGLAWLAVFFVLLLGLPLLVAAWPSPALARVEAFYRAGALVFGGGHVVLPLLQVAVVPSGWVGAGEFLAGYGLAQAVPGPLFSFAAFLGAVMRTPPAGLLGGLLCLLALFTPAYLLVMGALPFWQSLRGNPQARAALAGVNAAVVGLLLAALVHPMGSGALHSLRDIGLALLALAALTMGRLPPWAVVLAGAGAGWAWGRA